MFKEMKRNASDNKYLHRDFHVSLNIALDYLGEKFGEDAVEEYLIDYSTSYFKPKTLKEIKAYLLSIYKAEEAEDNIIIYEREGKLDISIVKCPAVAYIKTPSKYYKMTTEVIYRELANMSGLKFVLHSYNEKTGEASFSFEEAGK